MWRNNAIVILVACFLGISLPVEAGYVRKSDTKAVSHRGYQSIPESRFEGIFTEYLCERLRKEKGDITVSQFHVVGNRSVPQGELKVQVFQKDKRRVAGYVRLAAIISVNGVVQNRVTLSGWVDIFESMLCASRNLKRGELIAAGDLYTARRNVSRLTPGFLTSKTRAVGLRAKHSIREGTVLKEWMLERSPAVSRGDVVTIVAESGELRVTVPGRILETGYLGELVKVQNLMSRKDIYAKVINNATVMVDF